MTIDKTIKERYSAHGDWETGAKLSQKLKQEFLKVTVKPLPPVLQEGIDRIFMKISRIAVGDPLEPDHWHDIQGYAKLSESYCNKAKTQQDLTLVLAHACSLSKAQLEQPVKAFVKDIDMDKGGCHGHP